MKRFTRFALIVICFFYFTNCSNREKKVSKKYSEEIETYFEEIDKGRIKYLQLAGLFKMNENHVFGTNLQADLRLEHLDNPGMIGRFEFKGSDYLFKPNPDLGITDSEGQSIDSLLLSRDENGNSPLLNWDRIKWQVITRAGDPYLRVWDSLHPMVDRFKGFERFPIDPGLVLKGEFMFYDKSESQEVDSQLGVATETTFIGEVSFKLFGMPFSLKVGNSGFTMVHDLTSGDSSYGGGRYIYLDLPEADGEVTIDFNKLYNPPCSFSQFTTCLYPPVQNRLNVEIMAGETIRRKI